MCHVVGFGNIVVVDVSIGTALIVSVVVSFDVKPTPFTHCFINLDDVGVQKSLFSPDFVVDYQFDCLRFFVFPSSDKFRMCP